MLDCLEERFFVVGMFDLLGSNYLGLAQDFNCIEAEIVLASDYTQEMNGRQARAHSRNAPRWTRPKLPVPSVWWIIKSVSLYVALGLEATRCKGASPKDSVLTLDIVVVEMERTEFW